MPLCRCRRIKDNGDVGGFLLGKYLQERVRESKYNGSIHSPGVDPRIVNKSKVRPVDQGVCVEEEKLPGGRHAGVKVTDQLRV